MHLLFQDSCSLPVLKSSVIKNVLNCAKFEANQQIKKTDGAKGEHSPSMRRFRPNLRGSLTGKTKLTDVNNAGTKTDSQCILILTEGDSAKAFAVAGWSRFLI
jgi:DNA topoisomerase II